MRPSSERSAATKPFSKSESSDLTLPEPAFTRKPTSVSWPKKFASTVRRFAFASSGTSPLTSGGMRSRVMRRKSPPSGWISNRLYAGASLLRQRWRSWTMPSTVHSGFSDRRSRVIRSRSSPSACAV